jgi:hypothetical protein
MYVPPHSGGLHLCRLDSDKNLLFDSHGHLRSKGKTTVNNAGVLWLDSLPKNPVYLLHVV